MRLIAALLLSVLSIGCTDDQPAVPTSADWVNYGENVEATFYYDPATITKQGNLRRVWEVQDLKRREEFFGALSRRLLTEYDCKLQEARYVYISAHAEKMAGGEILITTADAGGWRYIPQNTVGFNLALIVCR